MDKQFGLGWKKDKFDKRDYLHKDDLRRVSVVPDVFVMDQWLPTVRNQGNVGSCVGFGIAANLTARAKQRSCYTEWFSPTWIYNGARFIEGTLNSDVGAYPRDALDWLKTKGCLLEHFWPYNPNTLDTTSPPSSLDSEAGKKPLLAYYRVTGGVDGICSALASGYYVSIGTYWFLKWMNPGADGLLSEVVSTDLIVGGHETCLFGYNKTIQLFYGINSWGTGWGRAGFYSMPFSVFNVLNSMGGYDAHYVTVEWAAEPTPPTPPTPEPTPEPENKSQWLKWLLIGLGGAGVIGAAIAIISSL